MFVFKTVIISYMDNVVCSINFVAVFKTIKFVSVTLRVCDDPENHSTIYNYGDVYVSDKPIPKCDEGQELAGGLVIQCVVGNNPNSTQWNDSLPYCRGEYL